jgi:hypothetical protein
VPLLPGGEWLTVRESAMMVRPGRGVEVGDLDLNLCVLEFRKCTVCLSFI